MLKFYFSIFLSLVLVFNCFASDKIYLNNGLIIDGTIIQMDLETVTIKYGDKDLTRTLHKDAIKVIIYEDGTAKTFPKIDADKEDNRESDAKKLEESVTNGEVKSAKKAVLTTGIIGCAAGIGFCFLLFFIVLIA